MTERDVLAELTRELRDDASASSLPSDLVANKTRARVVATVRRRRAVRVVLQSVVTACVGLVFASTAWAALGGPIPKVASEMVSRLMGNEPAPPAEVRHRRPTRRQDPVAPVVETPVPGPVVTVTPPIDVQPARVEPKVAHSAPPSAATLYSVAHKIHFKDQRYDRAVSAWRDYLRADAHGTFAAEAHYNLAIALIRAGRLAEARRELQPFSDGTYDGYRQEEARALLATLAARASE